MPQFKPGTRLKSAVCNTEVMVVLAPATEVGLACGGAAMVEMGSKFPPIPCLLSTGVTILSTNPSSPTNTFLLAALSGLAASSFSVSVTCSTGCICRMTTGNFAIQIYTLSNQLAWRIFLRLPPRQFRF